MRDLPAGPELLAAARAVLLDDLMPLLPAERRFDALLIANCLAVAEREAANTGWLEASTGELAALYGLECLSSARAAELWRRFAGDLRAGAFEDAEREGRRARATLWRLTTAKLRLANPKFLSANGFADAAD
jgi:hypothetical protein